MSWLASNWIWVVLVAGFLAFHLFGHGRGHGGHRRAQQLARQEPEPGAVSYTHLTLPTKA